MKRQVSYSAVLPISLSAIVIFAVFAIATKAEEATSPTAAASSAPLMKFPEGTATPSEVCGGCHRAIYQEAAQGSGSDLNWAPMKSYAGSRAPLALPKGVSKSSTAHFIAGIDPWPLDAMHVEENGKQCDVCHYPEPLQYPDINAAKIDNPKPRLANQERGITCASCHLTPDGRIRGPYAVAAPHATVKDEKIQTSVACAFCHSNGERVVGKQTQTFLEWREDFNKPGLGPQQCQDCHMPKTTRKLAEGFDVPERPVARHLWTGGHSFQRIGGALTLSAIQMEEGKPQVALHVTNIGAGHSVPTGSNRRAVYLNVEVVDSREHVVASKEWMFAPSFAARPDDRTFVEEDKKGSEPVAATQADLQGPHESIIRAGEERVLNWTPEIPAGHYTVRAHLIHDLNRYNERSFKDDQHKIAQTAIELNVASPR